MSPGVSELQCHRLPLLFDFNIHEFFCFVDDKLSVIEDRPTPHLLDTGISVMMNNKDYNWCTNCNLYLIVNMIDDKRVYVTGSATSISSSLSNTLKRYFMVNDGKTECLSYSIASTENDQVYTVKNFQGAADIFVARKNEPATKSSSSVRLLSENLYPSQSFIVTIADRDYWGGEYGNFFLCAQAYDAYSAYASVHDAVFNGIYNADKFVEYNMLLHTRSGLQFKYY